MNDTTLQRLDSELAGWSDPVQRLTEALRNNEFELYCQPILPLNGSRDFPMGEVLVRLREEEKALLPPGEFLPAFEHYGMMPQLDRWVVFHTVKRLARSSRIPRLTVNVAAQTLQDPDFFPYVEAALHKFSIQRGALLFEVDEGDMLDHPAAAAAFANAAKGLGCGMLIDGFGRRAVSFAPLKEMRLDFVKVDGGLVLKLLSNEAARTKMTAIVRFAEAQGIGVVAECVEDKEVLAQLTRMHVSHAQGFGVHKPAPIALVT